jgi:hypothetical protein
MLEPRSLPLAQASAGRTTTIDQRRVIAVPERSVLVSINQQVARRRLAAQREADTRLADRLGGTWTLLTQVLTAAPLPLSDHPTTPELDSTPHEFAATAREVAA